MKNLFHDWYLVDRVETRLSAGRHSRVTDHDGQAKPSQVKRMMDHFGFLCCTVIHRRLFHSLLFSWFPIRLVTLLKGVPFFLAHADLTIIYFHARLYKVVEGSTGFAIRTDVIAGWQWLLLVLLAVNTKGIVFLAALRFRTGTSHDDLFLGVDVGACLEENNRGAFSQCCSI